MIGKVVGITVALICVAVILSPIIAEYATETKTVTNDGAYFAEPDENNHTIVFKEGYATVDDVDVEYPVGYGTGNAGNATVILGSNWMFRLDSGLLRLILAGPEQSFVNFGYVTDEVTVTISGTDLTYTYNDTEVTLNNVEYYLAEEGDMVLCYNPYITEDSLLVGGIRNNSNTASADCFEIVKGTVADGFTATNCRSYISTASPTTGDFTSTATATTDTVDGDLLKLTKISQDLTFWDESTATFTITYLLAPSEITYDNPEFLGAGIASILLAIPVMMIVAVVMMSVGLVTSKRD